MYVANTEVNDMLQDKCVVVGVCGGIAAYKVVEVVSRLKKLGAEVHVIMTKSAQEFVGKLTFQTMSQNLVMADMFEEPRRWDVEHIAIARKADILLIAPATANIIAKLTHGIADDMLSTVVLATHAPIMIAPAMNHNMYTNPITEQNMQKLAELGYAFIDPTEGFLAEGMSGKGRLAEPETIVNAVVKELAYEKDLAGVNILVTAGATQEAIDPVRYITNHSTGKMGYAIAKAAMLRGANVTLVTGKTQIADIGGVDMVNVTSAQEMYDTVVGRSVNADIIIKAAAVGDFAPEVVAADKIKKSENMTISLKKNPDILAELGKRKMENQVNVGFCMETQDLLENAKAKLSAKNCDFMVANNLKDEGAGFAHDTNTVTILGDDGSINAQPNMSKEQLAHVIIDIVKKRFETKR